MWISFSSVYNLWAMAVAAAAFTGLYYAAYTSIVEEHANSATQFGLCFTKLHGQLVHTDVYAGFKEECEIALDTHNNFRWRHLNALLRAIGVEAIRDWMRWLASPMGGMWLLLVTIFFVNRYFEFIVGRTAPRDMLSTRARAKRHD